MLILACLGGLVVGSLTAAATVLASGTSTSAGDQQYVDPLTATTSTSQTATSSSGSSSSGSSSSSSSSSSLSSAAPSPLASGTTSSSSTTSAHSGTLPFTGMNVWACVAIGVGLLGTGLVLRRTVSAG